MENDDRVTKVHKKLADLLEPYLFEDALHPKLKDDIEEALLPLESVVSPIPPYGPVVLFYRFPTDEDGTFRRVEIAVTPNRKGEIMEEANIAEAFEITTDLYYAYGMEPFNGTLSLKHWHSFIAQFPNHKLTLGNVERSSSNGMYGFPVMIDGEQAQWWPLIFFFEESTPSRLPAYTQGVAITPDTDK